MSAFGANRRLKRKAEFAEAQGRGSPLRTRDFVFLCFERPETGPARLGLVVSRKVGNAVVRNRIKRLCREVFREASWLPPKLDLVVIARSDAARVDSLAAMLESWRHIRRRLSKDASSNVTH